MTPCYTIHYPLRFHVWYLIYKLLVNLLVLLVKILDGYLLLFRRFLFVTVFLLFICYCYLILLFIEIAWNEIAVHDLSPP